ncbi:protease complex subunit PrcB family protein [Flavobacterium cellulosilyticum]|uniref:Protease complex subunit PrcB family protein n=1 Tax=Flavobacterium cellulosilyticum TaxID=2541731 RepID=A0A4R5C9K2_9FLAO|nr:protease complex subunit PrcB family protein [Flavobacterium cellulosilyticum]TDD95935.1 protease complex subunit PrcB family protein [Flavobacterium cellulosilyticum]
MKKAIILLLSLILFSCATSVKKNVKKPLFEILTEQSDGGANIRFFEILSEPNEITMLQNDEKLKHKINSNDIQNSNFIVLNLGEKTSEGYGVKVESVVETEKNIIITLKEISPDKNAISTQVITTPYTILKINSKKEIIIK